MYQIILASESPRRKQLLENSGFSFETFPSKVSEKPNKNLTVNEQILDIARRKARFVYDQLLNTRPKPFLVLAADTMVILNGEPLGKPKDENEAFLFLSQLSGRGHQVCTAVVVVESKNHREISHLETTEVEFHKLEISEIRSYIATGEPLDKAGAYGIQGLGSKLVKSFKGSYENVVGLPIDVVKNMLREIEKG